MSHILRCIAVLLCCAAGAGLAIAMARWSARSADLRTILAAEDPLAGIESRLVDDLLSRRDFAPPNPNSHSADHANHDIEDLDADDDQLAAAENPRRPERRSLEPVADPTAGKAARQAKAPQSDDSENLLLDLDEAVRQTADSAPPGVDLKALAARMKELMQESGAAQDSDETTTPSPETGLVPQGSIKGPVLGASEGPPLPPVPAENATGRPASEVDVRRLPAAIAAPQQPPQPVPPMGPQPQTVPSPAADRVAPLPTPPHFDPRFPDGPPALRAELQPHSRDRLQSFYARSQDIRDVLGLLSSYSGIPYIPTRSVAGPITVSLENVTFQDALQSVLRTNGLVARPVGDLVYVGPPKDFLELDLLDDRIGTRIFRPSYVRAADLEQLIRPLLSVEVGKLSISTAALNGIGPNDNDGGGDLFSAGEAMIVQDYESVLAEIEQIVYEIDRKPMQVAIEAMILAVQLKDDCHLGVDFRFLSDNGYLRFGIGSGPQDMASVTGADSGLKFAYVDGNIGMLVKALETFGDANVIATPRLMALNKQRAEILIGAQLGYINTMVTETAATQSVDFLEVGTQLRLRPFISPDGMVRMEVHPELSTGRVRIEEGMTIPDKEVTKVTTNIMVRDGSTMIIGGLMREDLNSNGSQVPWIGNLPYIGPLFRKKDQVVERREILILITPRIVYEPEAALEGELAATEFHRRQAVFADKMSPLGKRYIARKHFRLAQEAWAQGDAGTALHQVNLAIHVDPNLRAAIDLRADIIAGNRQGKHVLNLAPPAETFWPEPTLALPEPDELPPPRTSQPPRASQSPPPSQQPSNSQQRTTSPQPSTSQRSPKASPVPSSGARLDAAGAAATSALDGRTAPAWMLADLAPGSASKSTSRSQPPLDPGTPGAARPTVRSGSRP